GRSANTDSETDTRGAPRRARPSRATRTRPPRRPGPARRPLGRWRSGPDLRTAIRTSSVAPDDPRGRAGEPHDVQPRVGAVREVHEPALVRLDVVGLDRHLAAPWLVDPAAAGVTLGGCGTLV